MAGTPTIAQSLITLAQRTGSSSSGLTTEADRAAFQNAVATDLSNLVYELNVVYKPLVEGLHDPANPKTLDLGLSGNVVYTDISAVDGSGDAYWYSGDSRQCTIKETVDVLLAQMSGLENDITNLSTVVAYDDTSIWDANIQVNENLTQVVGDAFGGDYHLDGDGIANLLYSLAQHVDELGAFFTGFPGTGLTGYANAYPAITFSAAAGPFSVAANVISNAPSSYANDDFVVGSPTLDYDATLDHAARLWFDKSKGALRAGMSANTSWDTANVGNYSVSLGYQCMAYGTGAIALGYSNTITGINTSYSGILSGRLNDITQSNDSVIGGGYANGISSSAGNTFYRNHIGGGANNQILQSYNATIAGGTNNQIGDTAIISSGSFVGGGDGCWVGVTASHFYGVVVGGLSNQIAAAGSGCFIGSGESNLITGAASDQSVIVGGILNQITNSSYSVICGGGDPVFTSNFIQNGAHDFVGGGWENGVVGSASSSIIGGAQGNIDSSDFSVICGGRNNHIATYDYACIPYGQDNTVTAEYGCAAGHEAVATNYGESSFANGMIAVAGDAQTSVVILKMTTTDDTPTVMVLGDGASTYAMNNDSTYLIENSIVARGADNFSTGWKQYGVMDRNATAATTALVGTVTTTIIGDDNAGAWHCPMTADVTTGGPTITVQGEIGKTINWVAVMRLTKVTG